MPEGWRDCVIVPIFKEKGASRLAGIIEASSDDNIWHIIIDRRLKEDTSRGEEQFGFIPGS